MRVVRPVLTLLALSLIATGAADAAPAAWLDFQPPEPAPGERITLHLHDPSGAEQPYRAERTGRFQRIWRHGRADMRGEQDRTPAAAFVEQRPGVVLVAYDAADGRSFCKTFVVIGSPEAGDPLRWSELGQRLEIVPQTDPVQLARAGGTLELQVLLDREPLAGSEVTAIPPGGGDPPLRGRTDEIGVTRIAVDRSGGWRVQAVQPADDGGEALTSTLYLVVGPAD